MDKNRRRDLEDIWYTVINLDIKDSYKEKNKQYVKEIELMLIFGSLRHQRNFSEYLEGDREERINKVIDMIEVATKKYDNKENMKLDQYDSLFREAIREIEKRKNEEQKDCMVYVPKKERDDDGER